MLVAFAVISIALPSSPAVRYSGAAWAGSRNSDRDDSVERARLAAERAQQAAEKAQQAAEKARQAAERAREKNDDNNDTRSDTAARSQGSSSAATSSPSSNATSGQSAGSSVEKASKSADSSDDKSSKSDRRSSRSDAATTVKDEPPPATIAEFFKRLSNPAADSQSQIAPKTEGGGKSQSVPSATPQATTTAPPTAATTTNTTTKPRTTVSGPLDLPVLPSPRRQILALNPSVDALAAADRLGFKALRTTTLSSLGWSVTQLLLPDGMSALAAREVLGAGVSNTVFAPNIRYRPFRAAGGEKDGTDGQKAIGKATVSGGCAPERCFGPPAIGWRSELAACTKGLKIGVIDTPVDHRHPAFDQTHLKVGTFIPDGRKRTAAAHGTGVLALLAGGHQSGTPGLIPDAEYYVGDIFHVDDDGQASADTVSLLKALDWMERWDVRIVNLSVAGPHDPLMQEAVEKLGNNDMIFVAAAGNEGPVAPPAYPAAYRNVIAVTAVAKDMRSYRHANHGDYIDLAAPGVDIWTAMPGGKESFQSGTSFAVPFATALLATVHAETGARRKDDLLSRLKYVDLGAPGRDPVFGRGLISAPAGCGKIRPVGPAPADAPVAAVSAAPVPAPAPTSTTASRSAPPSLWQPSVSYGFASTR